MLINVSITVLDVNSIYHVDIVAVINANTFNSQ